MKRLYDFMLVMMLVLVPAPAYLFAMPACPPQLTVTLAGHEPWVFTGPSADPVVVTVDSGTSLAFSWSAESWRGTAAEAYRFGWDIIDPDDPYDPGWATPGFMADLTAAEPRSFFSGTHNLHVVAVDDAGRVTSARIVIGIRPPAVDESLTWGALQALYLAGGR